MPFDEKIQCEETFNDDNYDPDILNEEDDLARRDYDEDYPFDDRPEEQIW